MSETEPTAFRRPWSRSDRPLARAVRPLQEFVRSSIASAVPLLIAAVVAVVWANSPWWRAYERIWVTPVDLAVGRWAIHQDLRFWVNEGLMTAFFLLAGLEIKRELVTGELRDRGAALLPVAAAIGGMAVPALIFLAVTAGTPAADGWGMAMPTDLALSLAVVVVAARAAPPGARPFLLTLAIADDVLTVAVVAVFYAGRLSGVWLLLALVAIGGMLAVRAGARAVPRALPRLGCLHLVLRLRGGRPSRARRRRAGAPRARPSVPAAGRRACRGAADRRADLRGSGRSRRRRGGVDQSCRNSRARPSRRSPGSSTRCCRG